MFLPFHLSGNPVLLIQGRPIKTTLEFGGHSFEIFWPGVTPQLAVQHPKQSVERNFRTEAAAKEDKHCWRGWNVHGRIHNNDDDRDENDGTKLDHLRGNVQGPSSQWVPRDAHQGPFWKSCTLAAREQQDSLQNN